MNAAIGTGPAPQVASRLQVRAWLRAFASVALVTARVELSSGPRLWAYAGRLAVQVVLVAFLWRGLYSTRISVAGITPTQAVTYAVLAALLVRTRTFDRTASRDTVMQHLRYGTIVYWFLRPIRARHFYLLRAAGDALYGFAWAGTGYVVCLCLGAVEAPPSPPVAGLFVVSLLIGQAIVAHIFGIIDVLCFWTIRNTAVVTIARFVVDLLSGAFAAIWFFPGWFVRLAAFLPFEYTLHIPLAIAVGQLSAGRALWFVGLQVLWAVALATVMRYLWRLAADNVIAEGG